uniref:Uncharacterized protein n=1 Tax=Rangifer tarandus platyrhynchus TaxID=3082113 RepID=A0ACB0FKA0_RANTA|nr:unnamed protein product [Rangifer tarandus platyrhynchus]
MRKVLFRGAEVLGGKKNRAHNVIGPGSTSPGPRRPDDVASGPPAQSRRAAFQLLTAPTKARQQYQLIMQPANKEIYPATNSPTESR